MIGKEISESSVLEFLEKFSGNNFGLSDTEDNTSADLPSLRTLLAKNISTPWFLLI